MRFRDLKIGDKFIVARKNGSSGIAKNRVLTLKDTVNNSIITHSSYVEENVNSNIYIHEGDCELVNSENLVLSNETELDKMKKNLITLEEDYNTKKKSLDDKIKFCEDNNLDAFDDKLFKVYKAIDAVQSGGSKLDQAKAILEVVNMKN